MELSHARRGGGEPLVLIHGIGSQWQMWEPVLDRLAKERDVIAVDLPGFGRSSPLAGRSPTVAALTSALGRFVDGLGLERAHLAGNSLGGWVALRLAADGRARTVTALSPAGFWNARECAYLHASLTVARAMARALVPAAPALVGRAAGRTALFSQFVGRPWRIPPHAAVEALRNLAAAPGFPATLEAMVAERFTGGPPTAVPTTIAWGQRDRLLLPRQASRAARELPGARMLRLAGCGHVPTWDDPEQVAGVVLAGSSAR